MRYAILLDEEHGKVDFATKKNNERIIVEADSMEEVQQMLSDPQYVYDIGFQEEDVFKTYRILPIMKYGEDK